MNSVEDDSSGINEDNRLNNDSNNNLQPIIDSNFRTNRRIYSGIIDKLKLVLNFFVKFYTKIFGVLFFLIFFYGFIEIIQNNNPLVFYLEKGAECLENYFNSIDKIFLNIKSSSNLNSVRRLNDAFFGDEIIEENADKIVIGESLKDQNETTKNNTQQISDDIFDFKYYKLYAFTKNITNFSYKGKWKFLNTESKSLSNTEGDVELEISKNFTYTVNRNYISNIEAIQSLYVFMNLKDGHYRDKIIIMNFTLSFPLNFSDYFDSEKETGIKNEKILLSNSNISLTCYQQEILESPIEYNCNQAIVEFEFIKDPKIFIKDFEEMDIIEYSKLNIRIRDDSCKLAVDLNLKVEVDNNFSNRVWNYSLITTFISILEICFIIKLIHEVAENNQVGKNLCLITISINIIWNAFMCTAHFYMSMINEQTSYEYGTPSMTYFLLFSFFELRLLFFTWKARYSNLIYENNVTQYRKQLLRFYSLFYFSLFFSLLFMRYFFTNFFTSLIFFSITWIFQIIHSTVTGTKPPFSMGYVFVISLGKLFAPLYVKACPYNIFELQPEYGKMIIITFIILLQIGILALQKFVSPKILVPRFLKKQPYNFYKELNEDDIIKNKLNTECIICLELLLTPLEDMFIQSNSLNVAENNENAYISFNKLFNKIRVWLDSLKYAHNKKTFMVTPCNHAFHTTCFEKWIAMKNECPYCRRSIPPLE